MIDSLEQPQSNANQEEELLNTLTQFYKSLRIPSTNKICTIEKQLVDCQTKIITIVEFRKNLEKSYEIDQLKIQYIDQLMEIRASFVQYEKTISTLAKQCHHQQNEILHLQTEIVKMQFRTKNQNKKGENSQLRMLNKIQENVRELKNSVHILNTQANSRPLKTQQIHESEQEIRVRKQSLKTKQTLFESKMKLLKVKQQMTQQSEVYNRKYIQSLKQAVQVYQSVLKSSADRRLSKQKLRETAKQIQSKQLKCQRSCRSKISWYEKQLLKLTQVIENQQKQIKNLINTHQIMEAQMKQGYNQRINQLQISAIETKLYYQKINSKLKSIVESQQQQFSKVKQESDNLIKTISKRELQIEQLRQTNEEIKQKIVKLTEKLIQNGKKQKYQIDEYEQQIKQLNNTLTQLQNNYQHKLSQFEQVQSNLQEKINEYQMVQNQLRVNLDYANEAIHNLNTQLEVQKKNNNLMGINASHLQIIQQKINEEITKQWQENNQQIEVMFNEFYFVMKNNHNCLLK